MNLYLSGMPDNLLTLATAHARQASEPELPLGDIAPLRFLED